MSWGEREREEAPPLLAELLMVGVAMVAIAWHRIRGERRLAAHLMSNEQIDRLGGGDGVHG